MKNTILLLFYLVIAMVGQAKDESETKSNFNANLGADLVSNYMWRGTTVDPSPHIQGWGEVGFKGLTVGAWASVNCNASFTETNLSLRYKFGNMAVSFTDLHASNEDFFNFNGEETIRTDELMAVYTLSEKIPLQLTGAVILFGADKKIDYYENDSAVFSNQNNYSSYFEFMYPVDIKIVKIDFTAGFTTHQSAYYGTNSFACVNIGIGLSKKISITEKFSLPIGFAIITNPNAKTVNTVFKISI